MSKIVKLPKMIFYDQLGLSTRKFKIRDTEVEVRLKVEFNTSIIRIIQDDNYLTLWSKQFKTKSRTMLIKRARVCLMRFCGFVLPKRKEFKKRGKHVIAAKKD